MSGPIVVTKIAIPPPRLPRVRRRRLTDRLSPDPPARLTLVSAPAGFGKTTLASDWAVASDRPVAWLSMDEADGDLGRFLVYVVRALQTVVPNLGEGVLGRLLSPEPPAADNVLADLVNDVAQADLDLALVLDDYHLVDSRPVDAAMTFLLDHLPPRMRLVVTTREDPQLPLARYRSRGQLAELREADLRFTPAEAAEFLHEVMSLDLSEHEVEALESRTEGWIAGLQLAALSIQGLADTSGFIESFTGSHRFVLDYLVEEVLHRQSESIQDFLLGTSILTRLCGPLCDAVLPEVGASGQDTLEALERANLFLVPLDHERRWYRYHHLFATLLQDRLARTQPERVASLHQRASDWLAAHDVPDDAIRHALAAGDWARAADVIEQFSDELPLRAGVPTTLGWLESIPGEVRLDRPGLGLTYAWTLLMSGQLDAAERFLGQLAPLVAAEPTHLGEVFAIRVMIAAHRGDMAGVHTLADDTLSRVPRSAATPRSRILISLGVALSDVGGDLEGARRAFSEAYELSQTVSPPTSVGNAPLPLIALAYLAEIEWLEGHLREAFRMYEQARDLAARWGNQPSIALSLVQLGRAHVLYEWDDVAGAALALEDAIRIGEAWGNDRVLASAFGLSTMVELALGRLDGARVATHRAELLARGAPSSSVVHVSLAAAQLALGQAQQEWQVVTRWQEHHDAESASLPARTDGARAIALARAWLAFADVRDEAPPLRRARSVIESATARSQADGVQLHVTRLLALEALVRQAQGETVRALESFRRALDLAAAEGYVRSFFDLGPPAEALLRGVLEREALREPVRRYAQSLLSRFRSAPPVKPSPQRAGLPVELLTQRELEVLQLIAAGLSNREIGERLFLALSTVKGHARNAFDKLQVRRRTEAVARARELGLL